MGKKIIHIIDCLSDDSTLSSESDVDENTNIIKASTSTLEKSLFSAFHLCVGDFKMNHENESIIKPAFSSTMLLNIISFNFNSNSNHSNIIDISQYLKSLEYQKLKMKNYSSIKGSILYKEVMVRKYFDIFQIAIYQYDKNVMYADKTTNMIFHSRYPLAKIPSFESVSDGWMNQVFLRKLLYNKGYVISIEHVYREICKYCDFPAPSFDIVNKILLKSKSTDINFSNFIINIILRINVLINVLF